MERKGRFRELYTKGGVREMIKLNDEYYIGFDTMNIILYQAKTRGDKAKVAGEQYMSALGYYGSFDSLLSSLIKKKILNDAELKSIDDIIKATNNFREDILKSIIEIKPDTEPYKYKLETDIKE